VPPKTGDKLRVLCIGAHPDDPETACGGTLARYAEAGHDVHVLYMTKGELGIVGKSPEEAGAIRAAEAEEACKALGAQAHFFGHQSGAIEFDRRTANELVAKLDAIAPDLVLSHWPIDTEYDHQIVAALALHAWLAKPRRYPLYLFEVESGTQTLGFVPQTFVEIANQLPKKLAAIRPDKSQRVASSSSSKALSCNPAISARISSTRAIPYCAFQPVRNAIRPDVRLLSASSVMTSARVPGAVGAPSNFVTSMKTPHPSGHAPPAQRSRKSCCVSVMS
jgi:LmbE family N-acetylglucosaminyl deacetylase